ncbi:hypothetical protein NPIL_252141, partial [Nephila pilipes]
HEFCGHAVPILNNEPKFLPLIQGDCTAEPTLSAIGSSHLAKWWVNRLPAGSHDHETLWRDHGG